MCGGLALLLNIIAIVGLFIGAGSLWGLVASDGDI
jgi:hypothetical protein